MTDGVGDPRKIKPYRIAVDVRPLSNPHSGIGQYLENLLRYLLPNSPHRWFLYNTAPTEEQDWYGPATLRTTTNSGRLLNSLQAQTQFPRWSDQDQIDVFWSPRHQLPIRLRDRIRTVVTIHDLVWKTHPETMTRFGHLLEQLTTPQSLNRADAVITTSQAVRKDIEEYFPDVKQKLRAYALGSSITAKPALEALLERPYYLFCGSIEPRKNLSRLVEAHLDLRNSSSAQIAHDLVLVTGAGWKNEKLQKHIKKQGDSIKVYRNISEAQKTALLQHADFLVQPSLHEGFGLSVADAICCHLPVLASNVGALPEVAGDAAVYVDPKSTEEITEAILRLCKDSHLRQALGENAAKRSAQFSWQETAAQTLAVLEAVARREPLPS